MTRIPSRNRPMLKGILAVYPHLVPAWASVVLMIVCMRLTFLLAEPVPVKLFSGSVSFIVSATLVFTVALVIADRAQKHLKPAAFFSLAIALSLILTTLPRLIGPPYRAPLAALRDVFFIFALPVMAGLYAKHPKETSP